jgi:tetratricopeptide (TPR) repeat protein
MNSLFVAAAFAAAFSGPSEQHEHIPQLGKLAFESSCTRAAHAQLEQGLGWLHSFEYAEAERSFSEAAESDPRCAVAYWGIAMTYYHPLWAPPTPAELDKGKAALARANAAGSASQRERDYIAALDAFYRASDKLDHKTRVLAYNAAMADLHRRYPGDREAAVFYALSLVAAGLQDSDPGFTKEKEAGAILNAVLEQEPDHPGVAHYLIHSFDYPPLAHIALPAAKRYASIAPDSAHAQHMPSHIFTRLGLWEEAIKSDLKAEAAARAYARSKGMADSWDERLHAMDYLAYAYLQTGQDAQAQRVFSDLKAITRVDPPNLKVAYTATAIPARILLERRAWREAAALELPPNVRGLAPWDEFQWAQAHVHFARAIGAARAGNVKQARDEVAKLAGIEQAMVVPVGTYDWKTQVSIGRQVAEAWLLHAEGKREEAVRIMRAAADLDDATEKHPVTPGAILPAREQLGELLLLAGRPAEALAAYEASLSRAPRRLAGLYGAAKAAKLSGESAKSARYFAELAEVTRASEGTRPEVREARSVAATVASR